MNIQDDVSRPARSNMNAQIFIIGAGPAGLAAALPLAQAGSKPAVIEQSDKVGGMARTECYKGFRFDMGGHRFFFLPMKRWSGSGRRF